MKLCPYPFSRMQTKNDQAHTENKGGFFPCCPSWFNQSYWDLGLEKDLDDIWNGVAAVELRKKMYEGDYSFCNRNECKIPLLSIDELSDPNINLIETPISKENIEAIKQKNPVMPNQPSSLHLVADLRCNLKCPTCRPEVISNKASSVEAQEEFDLVHRLKDEVEIIKMASSGEVFYSQTQRSLLKSFNNKDFPKLRRVHIVSNGTLFNQRAYEDLLPGTEFIKDVSISMDAGSKEVYEKLRGPYWEQVTSNLEWLGKMRKAGKFELLTLNFTLIRDNYRDIPNLVELGKRNNVDRILIQKYNYSLNQGFKFGMEQEAQAVHLPAHPEHIHMLRTLELFKDDPILHTLLDLDGFEQKIESKQNDRKKQAQLAKIDPFLEQDDFINAFKIIFETMDLDTNTEEEIKILKKDLEEGTLNYCSNTSLRNNFVDINYINVVSNKLKTMIFAFQDKGEHLKVLKCFTLLSYFNHIPDANILYSIGASLKGLSRYNEAVYYLNKSLNINLNNLNIELENKEFKTDDQPSERLYYLYMEIGYLQKENGNPSQATEYFNLAYKIEPDDKKGIASEQLYYLNLDKGFTLSKEKKLDEALESFNEALKFEPKDKAGNSAKYRSEITFYANREIGFAHQLTGKYAESISAFNSSLLNGDGDPDLYFSMGISLKRIKNYNEAAECFNKVLSARPDHFDALMESGFIEMLHGSRIKALEIFQAAKKVQLPQRIGYADKFIRLSSRSVFWNNIRKSITRFFV